MSTLRIGDAGDDVAELQEMLNDAIGVGLVVDDIFGPATERAVLSYQEMRGLVADGIAGPMTLRSLRAELSKMTPEPWRDRYDQLPAVRVYADTYGDGYDHHRLRADVAEDYLLMLRDAHAAGAIVTSSGSMRSLSAPVSAGRSATSFHYLGLALDLFAYSGMVDPTSDPYIITRDGDRHWRVWARAKRGEVRELRAWTYDHEVIDVRAPVIDLTALMALYGFERIGARTAFFSSKTRSAAEWWHFQSERYLAPGLTTFGSQLLRLYRLDEVKDSPPWVHRDLVFGSDWA